MMSYFVFSQLSNWKSVFYFGIYFGAILKI